MSERSARRSGTARTQRFADRAASRATGIPRNAVPSATALSFHALGTARAGSGGRWGLVLGGGGVLGASWLIGALSALEEVRGIDARDAELIVGTSAGSVIGALLAGGVSVAEQRAREGAPRGAAAPSADGRLQEIAVDDDLAGGSRPSRPRLRPGSPAIIRNNRGSLRQLPRTAVLAGLAPAGRGQMTGVARLVEAVVPAGQWPQHAGYRAVALDYETGRRVIFGAPGAPAAGLSQAVVASCAIPGWFEPVTIEGRRYVDGGTWSATNADLLVDAGLDELFVLAPMVSIRYDAPGDVRARMERRYRVSVTRRCLAEARLVQAAGTHVTVLGPGPAELTLMGYNLMASARRGPVMEAGYESALTALSDPEVAPAAPVPPVELDTPLTEPTSDAMVDLAQAEGRTPPQPLESGTRPPVDLG
jgi:NTE family protein